MKGLIKIELTTFDRGRVIRELGLRRTDLVTTTKLFFGLRKGPNDGGLSRKQWVALIFSSGGRS
jgi:hypothetical protein